MNFQKDLLVKKFPEYKHLKEKEIMKILGYDRIYDCGNYVFTTLFPLK